MQIDRQSVCPCSRCGEDEAALERTDLSGHTQSELDRAVFHLNQQPKLTFAF